MYVPTLAAIDSFEEGLERVGEMSICRKNCKGLGGSRGEDGDAKSR